MWLFLIPMNWSKILQIPLQISRQPANNNETKFNNNSEINHTWELKCHDWHPCQQCGLYRRLILDFSHTESERDRKREREKQSGRLGPTGACPANVFYLLWRRRRLRRQLLVRWQSALSSSRGNRNVYCQQTKVGRLKCLSRGANHFTLARCA